MVQKSNKSQIKRKSKGSGRMEDSPGSNTKVDPSIISIAEAIELAESSSAEFKSKHERTTQIPNNELKEQKSKKSSRKVYSDKDKNEHANPLTAILPEYTAPLTLQSKALLSTFNVPDIKDAVKSHTEADGLKLNAYAQAIIGGDQKGKRLEGKTQRGPKGWFGMQGSTSTGKITNEQLKADLDVLRMRNYLDPKRFYKSSDKHTNTKMLQVGTVIESSTEFYSSRLTKKERKRNFAEEMMSDEKIMSYAKRKSRQLQASAQKVVQYEKKRKTKR